MKEFEKPSFEINKDDITSTQGRFVISPLESGFGVTVGNALRRVLLSSLPGLAVYAIEVEGAQHEYSQLEGVFEDLVQIVLNIKKLVLKDELEDDNADYTLKLDVHGEKEVKAGFIVCPDMVSVVNKDLTLCHLTENGHIKMTLHARRGRGLVLAEDNKNPNWPIGWIAVDSNFSPILKVQTIIDPDRVGHDAGVGGGDGDVASDELRWLDRYHLRGESRDLPGLVDRFGTGADVEAEVLAHLDAGPDVLDGLPVLGVVDQRPPHIGRVEHGGCDVSRTGSGLQGVHVLRVDGDVHRTGDERQSDHRRADRYLDSGLVGDLLTDLREGEGPGALRLCVDLEVHDDGRRAEFTQGPRTSR